MKSLSTFCLIALTSLPVADAADPDREQRLVNGSFSEWENDEPVGWTLDIGARNGANTPLSSVTHAEDGGLLLAGDASTMAWRTVSQSMELEPGSFLRVSLETRATGLRRQGRQYDNCYISLILNDSGEQRSRQFISPTADWTRENIHVRAPDSTGEYSVDLMAFLSKTGQFQVRNVVVTELQPHDSFQLLVDEMDRHYSHFASKNIDWQAVAEPYRERVDAEPREFDDIVLEMLGELSDMHVWLDRKDGRRVPSFRSDYEPNFHPRGLVARDLMNVTEIPNLGYVATTADGFGVIGIRALQADREAMQKFDEAVAEILDAPGILIDLRRNSGGAEPVAQYIAGLFADRRRAYAGSVVRNGPEHDDFSEIHLRYIAARQNHESYTGPVVCLIGPGCVSSGEGMAMMFKCLPHVTLVGQPTRGSSGNPQPVPLPNGTDVWFSRWVAQLPDGTPIEGRGVPPDVLIEHREIPARLDTTFDEAVEILVRKLNRE